MNKTKHYQSIDFFKGIAILMVIMVHYRQSFSNVSRLFSIFSFGQMGCQLFFVLSGFGCASSYFKNRINNGSVSSFYKSRLNAIAPPYYFMMAVIFAINSMLLLAFGKTLSFGRNRTILGIISNLLFINGLIPSCNNNVMPGGWYIGTTMLFYLVLPIVVYLLEKAKDKKNLIAFLLSVVSVLVLILLSIMFPQYSNTLLDNNSFGYFSALNQFPCFCLGITLFFQKRDTSFCSRKIMKIFFGVLLLIISVLLFYRPIIPYSFQLIPSFFGMAFYLIFRVLLDFHFENPFFNVIKLLGRNSYYMFLTHAFFVWPFPSLVIKLGKKINFNQNLLFVILLPISVILTYISAEYLKLIVLKIKKHFIDYCGSI